MKIRDSVRNSLLENLDSWWHEQEEKMATYKKALGRASTVEELMAVKKIFLHALLRNLPLSNNNCYFCILHDSHCHRCEYGDTHGICDNQSSSWKKIMRAATILEETIKEEYYNGEEF